MLPVKDVRLLKQLVVRMESNKLHSYSPGLYRSAAAIILRFDDTNGNRISKLFSRLDAGVISPDEVLNRLRDNVDEKNPARPSDLRILLAKRANLSSERWSGQIAFPGGRREAADADDFATARREAYEGLGVPLDSPEFILLGRLPDYEFTSKSLKNWHSDEYNSVQSRFVFLHIGDLTPSVKCASHEFESVKWMSLERVDAKFVEHGRVVHHLLHFLPMHSTDLGGMVQDLFPGALITFPSITVAPEFPGWRVWGQPLRTLSEITEASGSRPIDWPMFTSTSNVVHYLFVMPYHGGMLLLSPRFSGHRLDDPVAILSFFFVLAWIVVLVYEVLYFIYVILVTLLIVSGVMDFQGVPGLVYNDPHAQSVSLLEFTRKEPVDTNGPSTTNSHLLSAELERRVVGDLKDLNQTVEPLPPQAVSVAVAAPSAQQMQVVASPTMVVVDGRRSQAVTEATAALPEYEEGQEESLDDLLQRYSTGGGGNTSVGINPVKP